MKKKVLVSACLLGKNCRYNGGHSLLNELNTTDVEWIPVCPEEAGGLGTPRPAAELKSDAESIISGNGKIINIKGENITDKFIKGAQTSLDTGMQAGVTMAILKSRSPSCGVGEVYDGTFTGRVRKGDGLFAHLCWESGISPKSSDDITEIKKTLAKLK